jgi:Na+-transporting methylmalonyl-CoA/oxaloacetate decarboxylase gamma subunit
LDTKNGIIKMHPAANEVHYERPRKSDVMGEHDPYGIGMTVIAMSVVFLGLLLLYLSFKNIAKVVNLKKRDKGVKNKDLEVKETVIPALTGEQATNDDNIHAAIVAAIYLYTNDLHDQESEVITIRHKPTMWGI